MSHLSKKDFRQAEYTAYTIDRLRSEVPVVSDLKWRADVLNAFEFLFELVTGVSAAMFVEDVPEAQTRLEMAESILDEDRKDQRY